MLSFQTFRLITFLIISYTQEIASLWANNIIQEVLLVPEERLAVDSVFGFRGMILYLWKSGLSDTSSSNLFVLFMAQRKLIFHLLGADLSSLYFLLYTAHAFPHENRQKIERWKQTFNEKSGPTLSNSWSS